MRFAKTASLAIAVLAAAAGATAAQEDVIRELQRKAQANEKDDGYCAGIAGGLQRLEQAQVRARLNDMLSRSDTETVTIIFASGGKAGQPIMCFYLTFQHAFTREGKKCRDSAVYGCVGGRDCRTKHDDPICEKSPGVWD